MTKPAAAPPDWVGAGKLIRPGLTMLGAKTKLYAEGFTYLGGGACAAAFLDPAGDRVVKLVCDDSGHRAAVALFAEHPEEVAFPVIYGIADLDGGFAYETERLDTGDQFLSFSRDRYWDADEQRDDLAQNFGDTVADLLMERGEFIVDLHEDNLMVRLDGDDVIVDPWHSGDFNRDSRGSLFGRDGHRTKSGYSTAKTEIWDNVRWRARRKEQLRLPLAA